MADAPGKRYNRGIRYSLPQAPPRIVKINGHRLGIQTYDADNGYPQRMESIINASPTAKGCVKMFVKYLVGAGCKDLTFYKTKINAKGLTPDKLLSNIAADFGKFGAFCVHVNWNALYTIDSVSIVRFKTTRLGEEPDYLGRIAIYPDWYNTTRFGQSIPKEDVDFIWKFDSNPIEIQRQVDYAGGWDKYQGQIYWYSNNGDEYPLMMGDEVIDPMITEIQSNTTTRNNVQNNFQPKTVWIDKGKIEDELERSQRNDVIRNFVGPNGDPVVIFESEDPEGKDVPELKPLENKLNDAIFKYTDEKTRGQIYRAWGQNAVLHSDLTMGRYNQNQLPESQMYYNTLITPERLIVEDCFREIFSLWHAPINPTNDYSILPLPITTLDNPTASNGNDPTTDNQN